MTHIHMEEFGCAKRNETKRETWTGVRSRARARSRSQTRTRKKHVRGHTNEKVYWIDEYHAVDS